MIAIAHPMREGIHPDYYPVKVACACGNVIETRSTVKSMSATICSKCHPFYTGTQKFVDSAGRVERFNKRYAKRAVPAQKLAGRPAQQPAVRPAQKQAGKPTQKPTVKPTQKQAGKPTQKQAGRQK